MSTADRPPVPVFFLSDSTGISAETMGNALLIQFPQLRFERHLIPFITTVEPRGTASATSSGTTPGWRRRSTRLSMPMVSGEPHNAANFSVLDRIPSSSHVLLIDDTWTSGGHSQSAALALRYAGAEYITLLVLARWLSEGFDYTTPTWLRAGLRLTSCRTS